MAAKIAMRTPWRSPIEEKNSLEAGSGENFIRADLSQLEPN
jgi:hypothetical protein